MDDNSLFELCDICIDSVSDMIELTKKEFLLIFDKLENRQDLYKLSNAEVYIFFYHLHLLIFVKDIVDKYRSFSEKAVDNYLYKYASEVYEKSIKINLIN